MNGYAAYVELRNINKHFNDFHASKDINIAIPKGRLVALLGPSGSGKTTILRMIAGLETPTEGKIIIGNKVVFDSERGINLPPHKRDVGFLFQNYALWPHMTVYQNIAFGLENMKWDRKKAGPSSATPSICSSSSWCCW